MKRKTIQLLAAAAIMICLSAAWFSPLKAQASEDASKTLVIEVAEEISVDQLDALEDGEVPLAAFPSKSPSPLPFLIAAAAGALGIGLLYLYRDRDRNRLLKIRKEGYRSEQESHKDHSEN